MKESALGLRRSPPRLLPPPREPRCARLRCWMARAWKLARGQRVPRVLLLCAASGMTEAEAALAGAHVTSVSVQPSRGWCGTHLQTSAEDYLVELRAEYKQRLRRLERAGTLERVALVQLLSSWGLWRLRRQDICLAHPSCKIIGTCGRAQGRSKREVQRALQLPLDLLLDKSGVFEAVYVENPAGAASWACPQLGSFVRQAVGVAARRGLANAVLATHVLDGSHEQHVQNAPATWASVSYILTEAIDDGHLGRTRWCKLWTCNHHARRCSVRWCHASYE